MASDYSDFNELLPVGYRFDPTPQELITSYLLPKIMNETPTKPDSPIKDCNVYGEEQVWMKEFDKYNRGFLRSTRYYFTVLKPKTSNGKRIDRETPCGVWKSEKDTKITQGETNLHIGSVRSFSYQPKKEYVDTKGIKGRSWSMQEYRLDGQHKNIAKSSTLVLCQVKEIKRKKKNNEAGEEEPMMITSTATTTHDAKEAVEEEAAAAAAAPANTISPQDDTDQDLKYMIEALMEDFDQ